MATFTGINLFSMTHGYNTPLLDYDIAVTDGMEDRGARTPAEIGNEIVEVVYFALLRPARST